MVVAVFAKSWRVAAAELLLVILNFGHKYIVVSRFESSVVDTVVIFL